MQPERKSSLPDIASLLVSGGDARVALNAQGTNKYGCFATPKPDIIAYSSCTASTISEAGLAAATQLYERLGNDIDIATYAQELERLRGEITTLCKLSGTGIIFSPSGTDVHALVAHTLSRETPSLCVISSEEGETGSGVPAALQGNNIEAFALKARTDNGALRDAHAIDAEAETLATRAVTAGNRVLLVLTDVSKTGLTIPSPACAIALKQKFSDKIDVMVDACQWRLADATLHTYLQQEFMVAITGSKFVTGPAFSAALLLPKRIEKRFATSPDTANYGLLLRWEAALAELRAFRALPDIKVHTFIEKFATAVHKRLASDRAFEPLAVHPIGRKSGWDQWPTIFPFRLRHPKSGTLLNKVEATAIYEQLKAAGFYVGQPVACGALRLCLDMRLIVRGNDSVIKDAMRLLDEIPLLLSKN
jgi:hypothetical protein